MMRTSEREKRSVPRAWAYLSAIAALLIILAAPGRSFAQQWTTNGNDISNANSGNVKIGGGASPTAVLHVRGNLSLPLVGTLSVTQNSAAITGSGTSFASELVAGDSIKIGSEIFTVSSVASNTSLTLDSNYLGATAAGITAYQDPYLFAVYNGDSVNKLTVTRTRLVGLGTTNPSVKLDVVGSSAAAIRAVRDNSTTDSASAAAGTLQLYNPNTTTNNFVGIALQTLDNAGTVKPSAYIKSVITDRTASGVSGDLAFSISNGVSITEALRLTSASKIGIGTTTPNFKLDLQGGQINSSGGLCIGGDCKTSWSQVGGTITGITAGTGLTGGGTSGAIAISNSDPGSAQPIFKNIANAAGATQFSATSNSGSLRFEGTGGTSVSFDVNDEKIIIGSGNPGWTDGGPNVYVATLSDNVGIGTTTPLQRLQIGSNAAASTATPDAISLGGTYSSTAGANPKLRLFDNNSGAVYGLGVASNQFDFMTPAGTRYVWSVNGVEKMRLSDVGNITVAGDIEATGTIKAKYQDVAEWVPSTQDLPAGTVVVLDHERSNHVVASSQTYDTRVAGVVSAQPGLILGQAGAGKLMVATTGRVRVKVDATHTPIKIGDLLVTSFGQGLAMKSMPIDLGGTPIHRPGTIIGKALEPLEKGTGEILVLLSLQ
jgi:hypothetical protein